MTRFLTFQKLSYVIFVNAEVYRRAAPEERNSRNFGARIGAYSLLQKEKSVRIARTCTV